MNKKLRGYVRRLYFAARYRSKLARKICETHKRSPLTACYSYPLLPPPASKNTSLAGEDENAMHAATFPSDNDTFTKSSPQKADDLKAESDSFLGIPMLSGSSTDDTLLSKGEPLVDMCIVQIVEEIGGALSGIPEQLLLVTKLSDEIQSSFEAYIKALELEAETKNKMMNDLEVSTSIQIKEANVRIEMTLNETALAMNTVFRTVMDIMRKVPLGTLSDLQVRVEGLNHALEELGKEYNKTNERYKIERKELTERNTSLEREILQQKKDIETVYVTLSYSRKQLDSVREELCAVKQVLPEIRAGVDVCGCSITKAAKLAVTLCSIYKEHYESQDRKHGSIKSGLSKCRAELKDIELALYSPFQEMKKSLDNLIAINEVNETKAKEREEGLFREIEALKGGLQSTLKELETAENAFRIQADTVNELREENGIKTKYIAELEKQVDDLLTSNKFYETQLIESDNVIKELREKQGKNTLNINQELNRIRQRYIKENGILKLKIEELEMQLKWKK